ncbi:OmpA family protein [Psychrobium sp. 1_MG-2023]|uniref:flagellar protein MotY n=1 Tax=Psychrobium sp. 1_MG-2023 TaxID=3062624 RepID=UPI000C31EE86|nr:OmpA family protein [Psychrobium sp. 1_MG-2023]MDP2562895.1 OmpA family protein [Psychrobium sp. 1_MG-2023]PKF54045.1 hypothetical protein CW748_17330 [Alteromonadales bacterium alter-6D02]
MVGIRKVAIVVSALLTTSFSSQAMMKNYSASIEQSSWSLTKSTPTACILEHNIPRYGLANFSSVANKNINLDFELAMRLKPAQRTEVELRSIAPSWRGSMPSRHITDIAYFKQFNGELEDDKAWMMLGELEKGMHPTFFYQDWYNQRDTVAVAVSAVNFAPQHELFMDCVANLLPYSFEDISFTTLNYKKNSQELDRRSQNKLKMIQDFLKHEPEMELVVIDSYTDSYGGRYNNEMLSQKRAEQMKKVLEEVGIAGNKITVNGYGEKRHIASNQKIQGRDANRRVVITMNRGY